MTVDLPVAFRAMCPRCGFELPPPCPGRDAWIRRDPEDPDPIASFEEDLKRKLGEPTAREVVTDDTDPAAFFEALKCPSCGAYLTVTVMRKESRKK